MKRWLAILFGISALLRLGLVWVAPAWYDEDFTLIVTRLPFARMLAALAGDVHPPLWYWLTWPLGQVSAPIWAYRLLAAIFSLACLWLFWRILQALELTPRVRAAALVLMALMPIQLYYALEGRMYAMLEFFVLAAFLALLKRKWIGFTLAAIGMLYSQYYGIFYLTALCIVGLFWHKFREWKNIVASGLLAGLAFLPWILVLRSQMGLLHDNYWMQLSGLGMVLRVIFEDMGMPPGNAVLQIPLMLAWFGWLALATLWTFKRRSKTIGLIALMAVLPLVFAIAWSLVWSPVLHFRPLIGITPFLAILLSGPVELLFQADRPVLRRALFASVFILPLLIVCDGSIFATLPTAKLPGPITELAYIQSHWQAGDIILHFTDDSWVDVTPYTSLPEYKLPDCGPELGGLSDLTRRWIGELPPPKENTFKRVWVFWSDSPLMPTCAKSRLAALGLDPAKPLLVVNDDEYIFEGLWLLSYNG